MGAPWGAHGRYKASGQLVGAFRRILACLVAPQRLVLLWEAVPYFWALLSLADVIIGGLVPYWEPVVANLGAYNNALGLAGGASTASTLWVYVLDTYGRLQTVYFSLVDGAPRVWDDIIKGLIRVAIYS